MLLRDIYPQFAIFDDSVRSFLMEEVYNRRYKILRAKDDSAGFRQEYDNYRYPIELEEKPYDDTTPIRVSFMESDRNMTEIYCWKTQYEVYDAKENKMIPVLDFSNRFCFSGPFAYTALLDSREYFTKRRLKQVSLRFKAVDYIKNELCAPEADVPVIRVPVEPAPLKNYATIPTFVAKLIKKQMIEDTEICPISRIPFATDEMAIITSCYHMFHGPSITEWMRLNNECPVCRQTVYCLVTV